MTEYPEVSVSRLRADLSDAVWLAVHRGQRQIITRHGKPVAVLVPLTDYAALTDQEEA